MNTKISPYLILTGVMLAWGMSWPSSKIGLQDISPMWFTGLRLFGASVFMFALLAITKKISFPKRQDLPMILNIGLVQMGAIILLVNYALQYLDAGRSALLVDSSVIWVTPVAILFFGERLTKIRLIGILLGVSGLVILIGPWGQNWSDQHTLIGYGMLSLATLIWAGVILYMRYGKWYSSPEALLPWQFLVGSLPVICLALVFEPIQNLNFTHTSLFHLGYNTLFATVFGYWGVATATKQLPTITTGLLLLGIPLVAVLSSHLFLHETLTSQLLIAAGLLLCGVYCAKENEKLIITSSLDLSS